MTQVVIYAANFHLGVIQLLRSHLGKDVLEKKKNKSENTCILWKLIHQSRYRHLGIGIGIGV